MKHHPPGALNASATPDVVMMICTAGHVDHGKTRLVGLLTGCDTDRLREEKERGLTIELGYAPCVIGGDLCVGIVDVPGHERFVRTMVAGVSGIDLAVLVIAADDGVMPQTVEHLQIMELLGVRHGVVALTKTDLVPPDQVETRAEEIRVFLEGTFLEGAPVYPVSSETFEGFDAFYEGLCAGLEGLRRERSPGVFRMPVGRAFSRPGFGTVVTGIPIAGSVRVGDEVELSPGGQRGSVRRMECFLREAEAGGAGQCLALNIPSLDAGKVERGHMVSLPGQVRPARFFHLRLHAVPRLDPPLRNAEAVVFHTGTALQAGKLYLLEERTLEAGQSAAATVALDQPVAAAPGDAFLLRRPSPAVTVGGGTVHAITIGERRPQKRAALEQVIRRESFFAAPGDEDDVVVRISFALLHACPPGAPFVDLAHASLLPAEVVRPVLDRLKAEGKVVDLGADAFVHVDTLRECTSEAVSWITHQCAAKGAPSLQLTALRERYAWSPALQQRVLGELEGEGKVRVRGDAILVGEDLDGLDPDDRHIAELLIALYDETGFVSPRPDELAGLLTASDKQVDRVLDYLCRDGRLMRLSKHVVLSRTVFRRAQDMVIREIETKGALDSADFKHHIGSSRKYALAILDALDARHVTRRIGNDRKLNPDYQRHCV